MTRQEYGIDPLQCLRLDVNTGPKQSDVAARRPSNSMGYKRNIPCIGLYIQLNVIVSMDV